MTELETESEQHETDFPQADTESLRLELQEALATYRNQAALLIQAFGVIITADSVLIAYGFAQRRSGILLVASLMPVANFIVYFAIITGLIPIVYVALRIELRLKLDGAFMGTWLRLRRDLPFSRLHSLQQLSEPAVRDNILRPPWYLLKGDSKALFLFAAFIGQFALFWISLTVYHYHFM